MGWEEGAGGWGGERGGRGKVRVICGGKQALVEGQVLLCYLTETA